LVLPHAAAAAAAAATSPGPRLAAMYTISHARDALLACAYL